MEIVTGNKKRQELVNIPFLDCPLRQGIFFYFVIHHLTTSATIIEKDFRVFLKIGYLCKLFLDVIIIPFSIFFLNHTTPDKKEEENFKNLIT